MVGCRGVKLKSGRRGSRRALTLYPDGIQAALPLFNGVGRRVADRPLGYLDLGLAAR